MSIRGVLIYLGRPHTYFPVLFCWCSLTLGPIVEVCFWLFFLRTRSLPVYAYCNSGPASLEARVLGTVAPELFRGYAEVPGGQSHAFKPWINPYVHILRGAFVYRATSDERA